MLPRILILHADGTNRDLEAASAFELAGGAPEIVHLNQLRARERRWTDYQILVLPGGFTYADTLGAGRLLALDLRTFFADETREFVASGKPVIGICNGFQALVQAGLLPAASAAPPSVGTGKSAATATLTFNAAGHFECRWVTLAPRSNVCLWTRGLGLVDCPVAHGEGQFVLRNAAMLDTLRAHDQIALTYARADGSPADGEYPINPNGSLADVAGICNPQGNVLGLMPHPEDHVHSYQHPRWTRRPTCARSESRDRSGLPLFQNGVRHAKQM